MDTATKKIKTQTDAVLLHEKVIKQNINMQKRWNNEQKSEIRETQLYPRTDSIKRYAKEHGPEAKQPELSRYTQERISMFSAETGLDPKDIKAVEKYNMRTKILSSTLSATNEQGQKLSQTFKSFGTPISSIAKKQVSDFSKRFGIDSKNIEFFEKFNTKGKLTSVRLDAITNSGKRVSETFKTIAKPKMNIDEIFSRSETSIDGVAKGTVKATSSANLLKREYKDIGSTLKNVKIPKDAFTTGKIKEYSKQLGIDPKQIGFLEKFNMEGKLTETRLNAVSKSGKKVSESFKVAAGKTSKWSSPLGKLNNSLNQLRWSMVNVMFGVMAIGAIASPFVMAAKWAAEYEIALKRISAITGTTVTEVRADILSLRKDAPFAINEVSDAYLAFTKAGFSAAEATKAVPSILNLSISGFINLAEAGKITAQVLHQFSLNADEAGRVADVLAKAANISAADVQDFGTAMAYVGPTAVSAGLGLEELAGALTILSNAGLKGSRMGTNLRQALSDIVEPSKEAESTMKKMGISFYTTSGKMKSLDSIVTTLRVSLSFLKTEEEKLTMLGKIFDIRGLTAINSFIKQAEDGKGTIAGYTEAVKEIGYANKVAAVQMEASTNQLKIFIENLKVDMITGFGETINKVFGNVVKRTNEMTKAAKEAKALAKIGFVTESPKLELGGIAGMGLKALGFDTEIPVFLRPVINPLVLQKHNKELEEYYSKTNLNIPIGINKDKLIEISGSIDKWKTEITSMESIGKTDMADVYKKAVNDMIEAKKKYDKSMSETKELVYLEDYKKVSDYINDNKKAELERYASALSIIAVYDELNDKLKYTASELKMTDNQYKNITEKVKKIKDLSTAITTGVEIGEDVEGLKELKSKLILEFSKMTDFSVNVKAMLNTDFLKLQIETIGNKFENLKEVSRIGMLTGAMKDLEKAKILVEDFKSDLETIKASELGYTGMTDTITEMEEYINLMGSNVVKTEALKSAEENFQNQIKKIREELKLANKTLTEHRDSLSSVNKEISRLSGQRFTGETEFLKLISQQNKYLDEQRLAELGIYDAQNFINNALKKTSNGYNGLVKSMEKVNSVAEESKNTYDSWKATVEEFIKASITSGESLGTDVTDKVKKFQTMMLGVTDMPGAEKGTTLAEQNLEKLKLAYDYYYGGMKEDVKFATMEHEDSVNGIASSSSVVISALQNQWSEQFKLNNLINESSLSVKTLNSVLEEQTTSLNSVTDEISSLTTKFDGLTTSIYKTINAWVKLNTTNRNKSTTIPDTRMTIIPEDKYSDWRNSDYYKSTQAVSQKNVNFLNNFTKIPGITRLAEGGIVNSPTNALIGEAGPEAVIPLKNGNFGNVSVTVNVTTDANPEEIAREVKRELMSL